MSNVWIECLDCKAGVEWTPMQFKLIDVKAECWLCGSQNIKVTAKPKEGIGETE